MELCTGDKIMHCTKILNAIVVGVIGLGVFVTPLFSQDSISSTNESGGMGYSLFGRNTIGLGDLNEQLTNKGYSELSESFFLVGGGGHAILNSKWIIGGEGYSLLGDEVTTSNFNSSIMLTCAFFDVGYIVYSIKDLRVYPLVGFGVGGMNLKIAEDVESLSLDEVLDNPRRGVELSTTGALLNLSIGVDYLVNFSGNAQERGGILLGIRAGYMVSPFKGSWTMDDVELSGAPEASMTGPYIRILFGGGAVSAK